jgi:O-antigen/teichoic acid export membrane protein
MFDYKENSDKLKPIHSGLAVFSISSFLYTLILIIVFSIFHVKYAFLIYLYGLFMNLQNLFGYIARGFGKNILYVISGLNGTLVTVILNIILIVIFKVNYSSLYISSCFGFFINILIIFIGLKLFKYFSIKSFNKKLFLQMLKFSLPLCLNSVAYWFLTSYNKVVIFNNLSIADNGLYAIAGKFSVVLALVTSCLQMAWQELSYAKASTNKLDLGKFYSKAINMYIKFLCVGTIFIIPMVYIAFPILIDASYSKAFNIIPMYVIATIVSILSSFLGSIFASIKETKFIFITTLFGCIINIICIHTLVKFIGVQAASIALFLGFLVNSIMRIKILRKYMNLTINYTNVFLLSILIILSTIIYLTQGLIVNVFEIIIMMLLFLFLSKNEIIKLYKTIISK